MQFTLIGYTLICGKWTVKVIIMHKSGYKIDTFISSALTETTMFSMVFASTSGFCAAERNSI